MFSAGLWFSKDRNLRLAMLPLSDIVFSHTYTVFPPALQLLAL